MLTDKRKGKRVKTARVNVRKTSVKLDELYERFIEIKKAEGRAQSTLGQYEENYGYFIEYLRKYDIPKEINAITKDTIREYIVYMRDTLVKFEEHRFKNDDAKTTGLAPSTINTRLKTLRVIFKCLEEEEHIKLNPMHGVKNVTELEEDICVLDSEELKNLLAVPNKRSYADFRDFVLMNFLLDCMTRISEAINLKISDFDLSSQLVTIPASIAKNRKFRILPLTRSTARLIGDLIRDNEADFDSEYVFLTNYGERISRDHFRKRLNTFAEQAKITKNVHPHLFRHTSATMFLENGGDIRHLQKLLGHADLRMVVRYTHLSGTALAKQHAQYSGMNQVLGNLNKKRKIKR
ncbi:tyrosine-type recombinase/integrase [Bacillus sp. FSL K6-3431]|uniref:tyrosine-type recombinase/integrase n=1 Tax=Bacillus sp. FSL K6-3431 TaxID=2921500 RepID=UPI0030F99D9D